MKKFIILLFVCFSSLSGVAQQLPLFSQYYFNSFIYNPSHSGKDVGATASLVARKQFTGLSNPISTYAATYQVRETNRRSGFGLYAYNDNTRLFKTNALTGSYAYHIPTSKKRTLSFGISLSALNHSFNSSNFYLIDDGDPVVALLGSDGGITLDAAAGMNMDFGKFSIGLSSLQLFQNHSNFKGQTNWTSTYTLVRHWMLNAGYKISLNDNLKLEPYMLYRKVSGVPGQVDLNLFLNWLDKGYAGIAYRDGMSFSSMLGVSIYKNLTVGYSYDITTSKLRNSLGNTHEISLQFKLGKSSKTPGLGSDTAYSEPITQIPIIKDTIPSQPKVVSKPLKTQDVITAISSEKDSIVIPELSKKDTLPSYVHQQETTPKLIVKDTAPSVLKKDTIPTSSIKDKPQATSKKYYVIAGSFGDFTAAQYYIDVLAKKGHPAYQILDKSNGRYYVHLGAFEEKTAALELLEKEKDSGLALWIKGMQ